MVDRPALRLDERVSFPPNLPVSERALDIAEAIAAHQVVIVAGETGSGKTTQLPKICLAMGRGRRGHIGCTQPRRIAATSVAARVAQELGTEVGDVVGYKVRFNDRVSRNSAIKFVTDGMLLAEIQGDAQLRAYDTIIVDEAHERSLNIDFLLGFLKRMLPQRPDLRVLISSATLETERFSKFFGDAPVISVSGRTYPVDVLYRPPREDEGDLADAVANTVNEIAELDPRGGDVLVFLPGEREIRDAAAELEQRALPHTVILPLFARLSAAEQQRVFQTLPQRRVVLATNVAETSLTIPGIVYVVDSGVARVNRYNVRTGVTQLLVEDVSRASADQRKGRCGRTQSGICFRLYEEKDYDTRPSHTDPEIKRVGLAGVILRMKSLRLGDVESFPFLDPPHKRAVDEGYRVLEELGAIDERGDLTEIGHALGRLPLDPRLGRMVLGGRDENALREVIVIAALLGLQDPRERPLAAQQKADEAHRKFRDEQSDFAGSLGLWKFWTELNESKSRRQVYKTCRENFLSFNRMREWQDIHGQLVRVMKELEFPPNPQPASMEQIHRALLPGLLSKLGMWHVETRTYLGARQTRFAIHPSSGLARKPPQWVMAAELVETSQLFARSVAKIDPAWVEAAAGPLAKRSHSEPHWEQKAGQVMAFEQVTVYGLPIVTRRKVAYAAYDPALCRELFITHALVRGEYATRGAFQAHNGKLLEEVKELRDKARKSDMMGDEYALYEFFDQRLPATVVGGKTFETWRREAEAKDPRVLFLSRADVLLDESHDLSPARYPAELVVGGAKIALEYAFDPSEEHDGMTAIVPLPVLPQLDPDVMAWTIPGWHEAKLRALLESLPKATRKSLGASTDELAAMLAVTCKPFGGPMLATVEAAVREHTGERIPRDAWDLRAVPAYLWTKFKVVDEHGKVLGQDRDLAELQRSLGQRATEVWGRTPRGKLERTKLTSWDFDALPESVTVDVGGRSMQAYPALVDCESWVDLRVMESAAAAQAATRDGMRRLVLLASGSSVAKVEGPVSSQLSNGPLVAPGAKTANAPARQLVLRAIDEAYRLADPPRDRSSFAARLTEGRVALPNVLAELQKQALAVSVELGKVKALLSPLAKRPGPTRAAVDDVEAQLARLVPPDFVRVTPATRFGHVARYLRGIQIRLERLGVDPNKDQAKAAPIMPLVHKLRAARATPDLDDFAWLMEELRIQTFAPELKAAIPVSVQRAQEAWARLRL